MKAAIVYDRVNKWGGAEQTILILHELFPDAPLYTAVYSPDKAPWAKVFPEVIPSFLQNIPYLRNKHEFLGTFTPIAFEQMDFSDYDLVLSVTSEAAKGIITKPETFHMCFCLTPTRYLWSGYDVYQQNPGILRNIPFYSIISKPFLNYVKTWDLIASSRPDILIANSHTVKERIKKYYNRDSEVIYPAVDIEAFIPPNKKVLSLPKNYYLVVSRLVPYKRTDLAVRTFNEIGLPLVVVGTGCEEKSLRLMAKKNIFITGFVHRSDLSAYYQQAKALIFPQEEDFGITPVEAQASGTPVIAYRKGGTTESVIDKETGIFFNEQTTKSLKEAVFRFDNITFRKERLIAQARKFSQKEFIKKVDKLLKQYKFG